MHTHTHVCIAHLEGGHDDGHHRPHNLGEQAAGKQTS